ncbi:DUF3568 family protein [Mucisphaera sp.]|uniref:DUF3568 family protein n=1 Tax=Mucisphaera sp. TaxID=2913024 RepID=UPI003D1095B2
MAMLVTFSVVSSGCIAAGALTAASIASIAGASLTAADKGFAYWRGSKLHYIDESDITTMRWAVENTFERLDLGVKKTKHRPEEETYYWVVVDQEGDEIAEITLTPITSRMIRVTLDVGFFGDKPSARLVADRIHLNKQQASTDMPGGVVSGGNG